MSEGKLGSDSFPSAVRWEAVKEIFDRALDLAEPDRPALIDALTTDEIVRTEVLRLLGVWNDAESWFDSAGQAVSKLTSSPALELGDILAGRYRIHRFIARGGMGEVYEAEDQMLSGSVALKILRPSIALHPDLEARFRKEIQLSRTINNPHICRVHDIEIHRESDGSETTFYTMELLSGETLAARLKAGPFTIELARPVIRGMALGLEAAHRVGVLHRDFKPGNVILTASGPVITDFGLAQELASGVDPFSAATPGYAAPEQLVGAPQTAATDVYSFGVVLYEMLSGRLPTDGQPAAVPRIIHQCLQKEPSRRPASTILVAQKLGAIDGAGGVSRRLVLLIPIAAFAAAAGYKVIGPSRGLLQQGVRVVIVDITEGRSKPTVFSPLSVLLREQLGQSGALEPVSVERIRDATARIGKDSPSSLTVEDWRQVTLRCGAGALVLAELSGGGESVRSALRVTIESLGNSPHTPLAASTRAFALSSKAGPSEAVQEAAVWVRQNAGESRDRILASTLPITEITTHSWEALNDFVASESVVEQTLQLAYLHSATSRDPDFALAWTRLGDIYYAMDRDAEGQACYKKAISAAGSHLAPREEFRIRSIYANDQWDYPEADRQFQLWTTRFPSDSSAGLWRISSLVALKRGAEAVALYSALSRKEPENAQAVEFLALAYLLTGQYDQMRLPLSQLRDIKRKEIADFWQSARLFLQGHVGESIDLLWALFKTSNTANQLRVAYWILWARAGSGNLSLALKEAELFLRLPVSAGSEGHAADLHLAAASLMVAVGGATERIVDLVEKALALSGGPNHAFRAGAVITRIGRTRQAREILDDYFPAPETVKERVWAARLRGHIQLALNRPWNAVRFFEQAKMIKTNRIEPEWGLILAYKSAGDQLMLRQAQADFKAEPAFFWWWSAPELVGLNEVLT